MTQLELAKRSKINPTSINRIIKKKQMVRSTTLKAIIMALDISIKEFFNPPSTEEKAKMLIDSLPGNEELKEHLRVMPPETFVGLFDKKSWPYLLLMIDAKNKGISVEQLREEFNTLIFYKKLLCGNCKCGKIKPCKN